VTGSEDNSVCPAKCLDLKTTLFEAAAHLPPTVSWLLLQALFTADLRNELYTHLALQALFI
jgi:hypothetical protein